ncbi:hypothetical protein [Cryobacterium tagatosivorans]|nr:hypothetical protein [Cryobacterium tagatosivorans]
MAPSAIPNGTMTFGPKRGTKMFVDNCEARTSIAITGRKDSPV